MGEISDLGRAYLRDFITDGVPSSGQNKPDKAEGRATFDKIDDLVSGISVGVRWTSGTVRVRSTASVTFSTALENGDTLNGVTLVTGDNVFLGSQSDPAVNGIWTVAASGAPSRASFANTAAELAYIGFVIQEGDEGIGERWTLPLAEEDITVGTTELNFALFGVEPGYGAEIEEARGGFGTLGERLDDSDDTLDAVVAEVTTARDVYPSLGARLDADEAAQGSLQVEVETARGDFDTLDERLDGIDTDIEYANDEIETARGGYSNLNDRLTTFDAAAAMAETIDAPAPGTTWSLTGRDEQVLAWLDGNGKLVNPAAARGVVPGTPHTAFAKTHLTAKVADDAEFGSFYTFADADDYPIMWSNRGQYPYGPLVELDGAVAVPAPLLKDAVGRASSYAIYPLPAGAKKLATGTALEFIVQWGQSLSVWSGSGGLAGQAWKAFVEWGGTNVATQLKMLNGGLLQPGMSGDSAVNGAQQASIVNAVDAGYDSVPLYNASGVLTGDSGFTHSSSAGVAHLIRRALGADGLKFEKSVGFATLGVGGQSITYFKTIADGGTSDWFANVFEATLANIVTAAASYSAITIPHCPLEHGEADSQDMDKAEYRGHLDEAVAAVQAEVVSATSQPDDPVVSHTQIGNALLTTGATTTGRPQWEVSDVALAILEKGLSTASDDLRYICVGPRYDLTFISISHLDHFGYLHSQERVAYVLNEDARLRAEGVQEKWFPAHATAVALETIDDRPFVVVDCFVPFPPLRVETLLLPKKPNYGFHFRGGSNTPTIVDCFIGPRGDQVYLELNEAWAGTSRVFGVAAQSQEGRQGWLTDDEGPAAPWQHQGMGCNVCDSAPWSSVATGRRLPNFLASSLHNIAD